MNQNVCYAHLHACDFSFNFSERAVSIFTSDPLSIDIYSNGFHQYTMLRPHLVVQWLCTGLLCGGCGFSSQQGHTKDFKNGT